MSTLEYTINNMNLNVLDMEKVRRYRLRLEQAGIHGITKDLHDLSFLKKIGAVAQDKETGDTHPTAAGLIMFGEESKILHVFPGLAYLK